MLLMSATVLIKFPTMKLGQVRSGQDTTHLFMLTGSSGLIIRHYIVKCKFHISELFGM